MFSFPYPCPRLGSPGGGFVFRTQRLWYPAIAKPRHLDAVRRTIVRAVRDQREPAHGQMVRDVGVEHVSQIAGRAKAVEPGGTAGGLRPSGPEHPLVPDETTETTDMAVVGCDVGDVMHESFSSIEALSRS